MVDIFFVPIGQLGQRRLQGQICLLLVGIPSTSLGVYLPRSATPEQCRHLVKEGGGLGGIKAHGKFDHHFCGFVVIVGVGDLQFVGEAVDGAGGIDQSHVLLLELDEVREKGLVAGELIILQ